MEAVYYKSFIYSYTCRFKYSIFWGYKKRKKRKYISKTKEKKIIMFLSGLSKKIKVNENKIKYI